MRIYGAVAEFSTPEDLVAAAQAMRKDGFTRMDACTPFPVHGIDDALGIKPSRLGWYVMVAGFIGMVFALWLQWWTGAVDYPLTVGGKPFFAFEPSIPITFELTVLLAAFTAVIGMFVMNGLPSLYHPLFNHERFTKVTDDKFVLAVEATDPRFHVDSTPSQLLRLGADTADLVKEDT